mmetsp:Transcript_29708/g.33314  ORF Transcript_29708/g.33314 Transcript_29708/m.33314 type:complete len:115 (+) Transcript_29708:79-423(+)
MGWYSLGGVIILSILAHESKRKQRKTKKRATQGKSKAKQSNPVPIEARMQAHTTVCNNQVDTVPYRPAEIRARARTTAAATTIDESSVEGVSTRLGLGLGLDSSRVSFCVENGE